MMKSSASMSMSSVGDVVRALAMDAVENAKSGHPGMPMGMAEIAATLWLDHLRFNPANPDWPDRDRFVLSNGHGSMLLYSVLHLTGYDVDMDDLKAFRSLGSRTPGHPERRCAPGVETTTGPLGQGLANAVGMAVAERNLAHGFNRPGHTVVDHFTYAFVGDGCLMEGISHEACSLAGTLGLGKLIVLYDDNGISIDGPVGGWFTDDTRLRFAAYNWHVVEEVDGHDMSAVSRAIADAKRETARPSLICCRTTIGKGAPTKAGSHDSHGAPLGAEEVAAAKAAMGWPHEAFAVPPEAAAQWDRRGSGAALEAEWNERFAAYRAAYPDLAAEFERRMSGALPEGFEVLCRGLLEEAAEAGESVATRKASHGVMAALSPSVPELIGGSADLTGSTQTLWRDHVPMTAGRGGDYIYYGVREFAMGAIMNGLLAHGGFRPFGGTYLVFSDYAKNAIRMAALMELGAIYILTHDSIALGQDGPTHQPVEQLASLRLTPNLDVWRPCDGVETVAAWEQALRNTTMPTAIVLSRQALPCQPRDRDTRESVRRGGYVLRRETAPLRVVILATGSEVALAVAAAKQLESEDIGARVVSIPSTAVFDRQDPAYRAAVLPAGLPRVSVEAAATDYWRKYIGLEGAAVGLDRFGDSAPPDDLFAHFRITEEAVADAARRLVSAERAGR
ncbi:transketolase [Chelativorans sp. M5D2P16]|uniref:transketolase n=1 Tax=Chelativorans sp. M5D2P16 TaxID=3095678 RepID=UPI003A0FDD4D